MLLQEALREAEAATKRAGMALATVMRVELRRRFALARAAADAALVCFLEAKDRFGRLDVLASELQRAGGNSGRKPEELEYHLAQSAEFAPAASGSG